MEQIFNAAFLSGIAGIFSSRLVFALTNPSPNFLNPLYFFLFPYFPGLSLAGGIIGIVLFLYLYYPKKKMPTGRIFDFIIFSFLFALPFGHLVSKTAFFLQKKNPGEFITPVVYFIVFIMVWKFFFPFQRKGEYKDGSLGLITLIMLSLVNIAISLFTANKKIFFLFRVEDFIFLGIIFVSLFFLNQQEKILQKVFK